MASASNCLVCLEDLASLPTLCYLPCHHQQFHYQCLKAWAQKTNRCPLCKTSFSIIWKVENGKLNDFELVDSRIQRHPEDDTPLEAFLPTHCEVCFGEDHDDLMLLCDGCDKGYHTLCLGLVDLPDLAEWFCEACLLEQSGYMQRLQVREVQRVASIPTSSREQRLKRKRLRHKEDEDSQEEDLLIITYL